ncbi:cytochrome b5 reductase 4 [Aspergillus udagawae]|uniref:Cytochrome b5 reductase 4 n=1 Tax=Aspergillus udagawae TaxID=91492 RepID=A0ABQ1ACN1_9EURO|nr:cytochrome b5 reductase 4 [Aspergillus udagawae]GFF76731.1 cytochrome b5 reductase 4 [Aspergillus udagawae]
MGWVGVVTLLATACYLFYRYPPASWTQELPPAPSPQPPASTSDEAETTNLPSKNNNLRRNELKAPKNENEDADDPQTTPKASATKASVLDVPTLHLTSDHSDKAAGPSKRDNEQQTRNGSTKSPLDSEFITSSGINPIPVVSPRQAGSCTSSLMPPPPPPRLRPSTLQNQQPQPTSSLSPGRYLPRPMAGSALRPPPSAAASLRVPPGSRPASNNSLAPTQLTLKPSTTAKKAILEPGYSPLDWAALTAKPNNNLRGANLPPTLIRVSPSMLKAQNGRKGCDAWTSYQGKVYNITPYLPFHPGGKGELLRGAGKDSGKLFMEIHPWVNWDAILGECLVGILVSENEANANESSLDAMD